MKEPASFRWLLLVFVSLALFFPTVIFGVGNSFSDDFSTLDTIFWNPIPNDGGDIKIENDQYLTLSAEYGYSFPYLLLKNYVFPDKDYSIEMSYRFSGDLSYGNGIVFSDRELDNGTPLDIRSEDLIFAIWPINSTTVDISSSLCLQASEGCINGTYVHIANVSSLDWKNIVIKEIGNHYELTIDNNTFQTKDSSRKISKIWVGNPQRTTNPQIWATIWIDYLRVSPINPNIPVIVLPGFGGSWDLGAILSGTPGNNWMVPEQITVYEGLMNSLKGKGYVEGTDLFLFPYDWRKPLDSLADDLKQFIETNNLLDKKVDLVGHSMGGLVARAYGQKYGIDNIDKIVTAGSPHLGLVNAYGIWEGAVSWDDIWWEKALLSLSTEVNRRPGERKIDTLRRLSPSIKDLLPTNSFLYLNSLLRPWSDLKQKNLYLSNLNAHSSQVDSILVPLWSGDEQTRSSVKTTHRSRLDFLRGIWEDGRPINETPFNFLIGDGTVTKEGAIGPFESKAKQGTGNHTATISTDQNIKIILESLGINSDGAIGSYTDYPSEVFIAVLRSPGRLEVCNLSLDKCNNALGIYSSSDKLFMLPGYTGEKLRIRIYEDGLGKYALHLGNIADMDQWSVIDGKLNKRGQIDAYEVVNGQPFPFDKRQCKKDGWSEYSFVKFKNEGSCVSYVETHKDDHDD